MTLEELHFMVQQLQEAQADLQRRFADIPPKIGVRFNNALVSSNFSSGNSGWKLGDDGNVEFGDGTFRGVVRSGKTSFTDDTTSGFILGPDTTDSNVAKFLIGDSDGHNYLNWNGHFFDMRGAMQFGIASFFGNFNDGLTQVVAGSGSVTRRLFETQLKTDTTTSSKAVLRTPVASDLGGYTPWNFGGSIRFYGSYNRVGLVDTNTYGFVGIYDLDTEAALTTMTVTRRHVGVFIYGDSNGTRRVRMSNADGTTQTTSDTTEPPTVPIRVRFEKVGASRVDFYLNDVLKASHTTNLPSTNGYNLQFGIANNGTGAARQLNVDNNYQIVTSS